MTGTADVIDLAAFRKAATTPPKLGGVWEKRLRPDRPEPETETSKNYRLRLQRRHDWWVANARREYWRIAAKMDDAISHAKRVGLPEGDLHPELAPRKCYDLIAKYREAIMAQLLMPAPTAADVAWKRSTFKHRDHEYTDVKPERIERAIADDVEFLKTHPTRRKGGITPEALEKRHAWKAAFRARVTLFAEQNGIDKTELAWLGRIKHQDIAAFAERHRLSYDWLLEGDGQPAPDAPIR
jgi:hypothetical protein